MQNKHKYTVNVNETEYVIQFLDSPGEVLVNGERVRFDLQLETPPDHYSLLADNKSYLLAIDGNDSPGNYRIHMMGYDYEAEVVSAREAYLRDFVRAAGVGKSEGVVKAPMPGKIVKLHVNEGDDVAKNKGIMVMEAMKMENEIRSPIAGKVSRFHVQSGDTVEKGQILFEISSK
ncbi:biotin/lipoyl-binding protein [bacterium]|nr:biotin/lipoyl-binding protein [bacterium]